MIRLTGVEGKLFVLDLASDMEGTISLTGGISKDVDENICTLEELKYIETSFKTKRVSMSVGDFSKVVERIAALSSSSGGGAVSSVNGEIGDVVIDASEIELLDGTSIEEKVSGLKSVAFSGNYSDLIGRPSGVAGEPYSVKSWNPYRVDSVDLGFNVDEDVNYINGVVSRKPKTAIPFRELYNFGDTMSINAGDDFVLTVTPSSGNASGKYLLLDGAPNLSFKALTSLPSEYDNGVYVDSEQVSTNFSVASLLLTKEAYELLDLSTLTVQEFIGLIDNCILSVRVEFKLNDTSMAYSSHEYKLIVKKDNSTVYESNGLNDNREQLVQIKDNYLNLNTVSNPSSMLNISDYNTIPMEDCRWVTVVVAYKRPSNQFLDVPLSFSIEEPISKLILKSPVPALGEFTAGVNSNLYFLFEDASLQPQVQVVFAESIGYSGVFDNNGFSPFSSQYIDVDKVHVKISDNQLLLKDNNTGNYVSVSSLEGIESVSISDVMLSMTSQVSQGDTFTFAYDIWGSLELVNGIIPAEINDGDDVYITEDGLCLDRAVKTGDYIRFYENKSKFILNRFFDISDIPPVEIPEVSGNVENAGSKAVSGDAIISFVNGDYALNVVDGKLGVVVSGIGDNVLQKTTNGLYVPPPPSTVTASSLQSSTIEVVNGTTLSVKRSADSGNSLEFRSNGLYIPLPSLNTILPSSETGKAPSSYTVYNAFNSNTLRMSGSKGEVKLSVSAGNRLVDSGAGLYVGPEPTAPIATVIDPSVHSAVSSSTVYNALTSNTIAFASSKANVKIENPASSSVQINTNVNGISAVLKNIVKLGSTRETISYSMGSGYRYLSLTNFNIFVIDCAGGSGTVALNGLNDLDGDQAKTITIIVKNATALIWAAEFAWVDNIPPILQPSTTLVVTGVYASNASNATYTGGKILCTFSYFTI